MGERFGDRYANVNEVKNNEINGDVEREDRKEIIFNIYSKIDGLSENEVRQKVEDDFENQANLPEPINQEIKGDGGEIIKTVAMREGNSNTFNISTYVNNKAKRMQNTYTYRVNY